MTACTPRPIEHRDRMDETAHYAGPFCGCGDFSCPRDADDAAQCVNSECCSDDARPWCPCGENDCAERASYGAECSYEPDAEGLPVRKAEPASPVSVGPA